ncbi:hypothetical protein Gorai_006236 [Gossypium raimondii]|uniref:AWPM-19-like family protein n=3 Tax=Gossypium raimondii TaxID=29730 RepID=A0A0D2VNP7_GOSRA|nr:hypothetical protein B456_011G180300 [Gossypium raimondii]MBA0600037.1 hypothetical protein [Gossypium raimondii]
MNTVSRISKASRFQKRRITVKRKHHFRQVSFHLYPLPCVCMHCLTALHVDPIHLITSPILTIHSHSLLSLLKIFRLKSANLLGLSASSTVLSDLTMATVGRNIAAPLLFLNLIMYFIVLGFASWCFNRFIDGQTAHPSMGGNGATGFFLTISILAAVAGIVSKLAGGGHIRSWRSDSLAEAGSSSLIAWALTALAFGFACKHINIGGRRGWRLRVIEALIIILTLTELLYVCLIHAGLFGSRYGPGYRDTEYEGQPVPKGGPAVTGSRV